MNIKRLLTLNLLLLLFLTSYAADDEWENIPPYFASQITNKIENIKKRSREGTSFIFITDTHVNSNTMHSPLLIKRILDKTDIHTVIWGGDAINSHGGDIEKQWKKQLQFDTSLNKVCQYYKVRGNHDFSILKNKDFPQGMTFSNEKAAEYLLNNCPSNIHRNTDDLGACYYFFDNKTSKVRFIILDSTDSVPDKVSTDGNIIGIHQTQLQWIADSAVLTTPHGYGLVFVSHIPITNKGGVPNPKLKNVRQLIDGVASHSSVNIGGTEYDFTRTKDIKVLMCIAGHIHNDSQTYANGILYLTTANDGRLQKSETVNEQCFECICISKNKKLIRVYRIGHGSDRFFHIEPVIISEKKTRRIKTSLMGTVKWSKNDVINNKSPNDDEVVTIDETGVIGGQRKGTAMIMACDNKGNKEFFNIIVQ